MPAVPAGVMDVHAGFDRADLSARVDDPNLVIVYLQARTLDQLHAFAESVSLKEAMKTAGVTSAPELSFVQGGSWE